jgi:hypothetical protein
LRQKEQIEDGPDSPPWGGNEYLKLYQPKKEKFPMEKMLKPYLFFSLYERSPDISFFNDVPLFVAG